MTQFFFVPYQTDVSPEAWVVRPVRGSLGRGWSEPCGQAWSLLSPWSLLTISLAQGEESSPLQAFLPQEQDGGHRTPFLTSCQTREAGPLEPWCDGLASGASPCPPPNWFSWEMGRSPGQGIRLISQGPSLLCGVGTSCPAPRESPGARVQCLSLSCTWLSQGTELALCFNSQGSPSGHWGREEDAASWEPAQGFSPGSSGKRSRKRKYPS